MTDVTQQLADALRPFAESLVAQTNVDHSSQDWREETDDTVVSVSTSHQRKGMPDLSPDHTLWIGAFRQARQALTTYEASRAAPEFGPLDARVHDLGKWETARDDGWMPIETADRSGDWFLLWAQGMKPQPFYWSERFSMWVQSDDDNPVHWSGGPDDFGPTHWRPLPAPPTPAQEPRS